jgi:DNA-binding XRE family transcriptional regulator
MPAPAPGSLGCLLREVRERQGLTREVLAGISGVSVTTISELELGITVRPHRATVRKLADALGLSGDELASFEEAGRRGVPAGRARRTPDSRRDVRSGADSAASPVSGLTVAQGMATRALPYPIRSFTGRQEELAELAGALSDAGGTGIRTIQGMPGVGKTALAVQAAPSGCWQFSRWAVLYRLAGAHAGAAALEAGRGAAVGAAQLPGHAERGHPSQVR